MLTDITTLKALAPLTDHDDTRWAINHVHVSGLPDGKIRAEATNGHALLRIERTPMPAENLPAGVEHTDDVSAPVFVSNAAIKAISTAKPLKNLREVTSAVAVIPQNGQPARLARWNGAWQQVEVQQPESTTWPETDRVIPSKDATPLRVCLGVEVLEALCKAAHALEAKAINLSFYDDVEKFWRQPNRPADDQRGYDSPIRVEIKTTDGSTVYGAAMPMRI